jgi:hypothetical protein
MLTRYVLLMLALVYAPFAMAASHSGMGWFGTQVVSSLIHGVVYGVIFKLFHSMSLAGAIVLAALLLGGAWWYYKGRNS